MPGKESAIPSVLLVANKKSGSGQAGHDRAREVLEAGGQRVAVAVPPSIEALRERVRTSEEDVIVLAGGDGTLNAALPALLEAGKPFGVIPMGTANDLARTLGIPPDPGEAAEVVLGGALRAIDVGRVNGRPFFNVASLGLSVDVARQHRGEMKRRLGVLNYPLSLWRAYRDHRPFSVEIVADRESLRCRCTQVAVGNGRHYGGGLTVAERAEIDDGWLRVYYLRAAGLLGLVRLLPAIRFGRLHRAEHAAIRRARSVELRTRRAMAINVDGELLAETPARFDILPGALRVFVPASSAAFENDEGDEEGDERMKLMRSDRLVALKDLVEVCTAAARSYTAAAEVLPDGPLAESLRSLASARTERADFFAARMSEDGDLPAAPPEERTILETAVTKAKAALSEDEVAVIRADCAKRETAVLDQAVSAQETELAAEERAAAAALVAEAEASLAGLFRANGET